MICTGVIPCLSTGLAKNSWLFGHLESLAFFGNGGQTIHQSCQTGCFSQFFKVTTPK